MATYTITQLKQALAAKYEFIPQEGETISSLLQNLIASKQAVLDRQRETLQSRLDSLPEDAREILKREAITWLNDKDEEQDLLDNMSVSL